MQRADFTSFWIKRLTSRTIYNMCYTCTLWHVFFVFFFCDFRWFQDDKFIRLSARALNLRRIIVGGKPHFIVYITILVYVRTFISALPRKLFSGSNTRSVFAFAILLLCKYIIIIVIYYFIRFRWFVMFIKYCMKPAKEHKWFSGKPTWRVLIPTYLNYNVHSYFNSQPYRFFR